MHMYGKNAGVTRLSRSLIAEQYGVLDSGIAVNLGLGFGCKLVSEHRGV